MQVLFTLDQRYDAAPDGSVWVRAGPAYQYWRQFLDVFEGVRLAARVREVPSQPDDAHRVDGEGVRVAALPYYLGPWQYVRRMREVAQAARNAFRVGDAVVFSGGEFSHSIEAVVRSRGYPYAMYVVGDPYDVFAPGAMRHPLRPLLRVVSPYRLRRQCAHAAAAIYVTKEALQRRYPCPKHSVGISDVDLPDESLVSLPRSFASADRRLRLVTVGTLAQMYKAPDVLIKAVAQSVRRGLDLQLVMIGDGKHRPELEALAGSLGISDRVVFRGQLAAGMAVHAELDQADLFVLASHQEGLPRAMVEAMARSLPIIGSTVGGIPELLPPEDMVPPGDVEALASRIREVITDSGRLTAMSARNLGKAMEYRESVLREKRLSFYMYVRERTEEWLMAPDRYGLYT